MASKRTRISPQYLRTEDIMITILEVKSPAHFVIKESPSLNTSSVSKTFIEAEEMMQKYYRSVEHSYFEIPLKDTVVIAYSDKKFYRAQVRSILNRTLGHLFRVYLVDYGRECNVPRENLYEAHKDFLTHPFQAVDFKLLGIEPAGLLLDSEDLNVSYGPVENWDTSAYKFVKDIQKEMNNVYIRVQAKTESCLYGSLHVSFNDYTTKCLNEELVHQKYAYYNEDCWNSVDKIDSAEKSLSESACASEPLSPSDSVFNTPTSKNVANSSIRSITESPVEEQTSGSRIFQTPPRHRSSRLTCDKSSSSSNASVCSVTENLSIVSNNSAVISPLNKLHKTKHPPCNQKIPRSNVVIVNAQKQKIPENINYPAEDSGIKKTQECSPIKLFEEAKEKLDEQTQSNKLQGSLERHLSESQKESAVQRILNLNKKNLPLANIAREDLPKQSSVDFKKVYDFLQRQKKLSPSNLDSKCKIQSKVHSSEKFQSSKLICNTPDLKSSVSADSLSQKINLSSTENLKSVSDNFHPFHSDNLSVEEKKSSTLDESNKSSFYMLNEAFIGTPQENVKQEMCTSTPVLTSSPQKNPSVNFNKVKRFILQKRKIPTLASPSSDIQREMSLLHHKTLKSPSVHKADEDQEYVSSNSNSVKPQSLPLQDNQNKECVSKVDLRNVLVRESEVELQHFNKHLSPELSPVMQLDTYPEYGSNFTCVERFSESSLPEESNNILPKVMETDDSVHRDKMNATVSSENADVSKAGHQLNESYPGQKSSSVDFNKVRNFLMKKRPTTITKHPVWDLQKQIEETDAGTAGAEELSTSTSECDIDKELSEVISDPDFIPFQNTPSAEELKKESLEFDDSDDLLLQALDPKPMDDVSSDEKYNSESSAFQEVLIENDDIDSSAMDFSDKSLWEKQKVPALCIGNGVPKPVFSTEEAVFAPSLEKTLNRINFFGPSCIQSVVWPAMSRSRCFAAIAPPHAGKTVAYLLPLVSNFVEQKVYKDLPPGNGSESA
ncbi:uncharacterized protein LOC118187598 isoform X2 [Stegodyphus dumicola]|uniref:uncharacterized protein LOC118187598 isoform X2 n=1 Tax=Stegodyphus dumicola TaxID=202533 RepID=UPI0015A7F913|nr:uncharacterized protein LOC118187598 isoform X2 [Stegodyphus dumicola]